MRRNPVKPVKAAALRRPVAPARAAARPLEMGSEWETERTLGWLFHDIHRLLTKSFEHRARELPLTRARWRVMTLIRRYDGLTQTELAGLIDMERAPFGRLLDKLEAGGWIERRADPKDRRVRRIHGTAKIDPYVPAMLAAARALFGEALTGISRAELKALIAGLERIKANLAACEDDGPSET